MGAHNFTRSMRSAFMSIYVIQALIYGIQSSGPRVGTKLILGGGGGAARHHVGTFLVNFLTIMQRYMHACNGHMHA